MSETNLGAPAHEDRQAVEPEVIYREIHKLLVELTEDWDVGEISAATRLGDVILESIAVVYFVGDLQQRYGLGDRLFHEIRASTVKLPELTVGDVVELVQRLISASEKGEP